jgi:prepilin signal peptidase PulO-like enzyme (type II secretory pathway)
MTPLVSGAAALVLGLVGGRLLGLGVRRLLAWEGDGRPPRSRADWLTPAVAACAAIALWWWEVAARGLLPEGVAEPEREALVRAAAHGVLGLLLAAATWIDLRHRVIPDAITVPGVLGGLAWVTAWPRSLLPVAREVPRSFAEPLLEADVLGLTGPLQGPWPGWLGPAPALAGLAAALAAFAVWWTVGTCPPETPLEPRSRWAWLLGGRWLVAAAGTAVIVGGWLAGGDHWRALVSALGGVIVSAGIVWLTRGGASLALGREAMGLGDVTLMAMVGAWLGWQPCVLACFLAVFIGLAHGVAQLVIRGEAELPFGPSLCAAAAVVVLAWRPLWERAAVFFERPLEMAAVVGAVIGLTGATLWVWHRVRRFPGG